MSIFSDFGEIQETEITEELEQNEENTLALSFAFDYKTGKFLMEDGSPKPVTGVNAIKQWLELFCRTQRNKYLVYSEDFGTSAVSLIGKKAPKGLILSEFKREIQEGALKCPGVQSVSDFKIENSTVTFTVITTDGVKEVVNYGY